MPTRKPFLRCVGSNRADMSIRTATSNTDLLSQQEHVGWGGEGEAERRRTAQNGACGENPKPYT